MSTHNICFHGEIRKILCGYPLLSVAMYIHPSMSVCPVRSYEKKFHSLSFEKISIFNSYFIHRYITTKYRSSSIKAKIQQLLWVMAFFQFRFLQKWLPFNLF